MEFRGLSLVVPDLPIVLGRSEKADVATLVKRAVPSNNTSSVPVEHPGVPYNPYGSPEVAEPVPTETTSIRVNIPCVIIDGYGKGAMYEAGDSEKELNEMRNRWNAVYVDGCWRLVHVYWGIIGLTDRDNANPKANPGSSMVKQVNDYFFLTDPEELITRCLPDEREWQLLKKPISWRQFASLPYYRPPFFNMGLKLTSSKSGTIQSEEHQSLWRYRLPKVW
ncbi:hypothetical protein ScPMuIL_017382 [Solemya velum]